ncbi:acetyl-CoA hydrolase/transferase family protein [Paraburkholderia sp. EG286B]|uniref:acetyl-CoA hydrolase/transferase family protein n=1 Tax=Paraburkholderia sp. EG286B TaxID=3237011 RepID=UPI0034D3271F
MKTLTVEQLNWTELVRPGDTVMWGQVCGEAQTLTESLVAQRASIGHFRVFVGARFSRTLRPEHVDHIEMTGLGAGGTNRELARAGVLEVIPMHVSQVGPFVESGLLPCDVILLQLSPPNERGEYSLGLISDYQHAAIRRARLVIAEINDQVPWVPCDNPIRAEQIHIAVHTSRPLLEMPMSPVSEIDRRIAELAMPLIPDRSTLQIGVGAVPEAIVSMLKDRRDLGIHSGMLIDRVIDLIESGAVTNEYKGIDEGVSVSGALSGTRRLYDFCHQNPGIRMTPTSHTHDPKVLMQLRNFVSMNSALEIDITGQVNSEAIGSEYVGSIGGQVDFIRASYLSPGGRSLMMLPASGAKGSRIVPRLSGPVTTARADLDVVITEHGVAHLRGRTLRQRIRSMIDIAAPQMREELERAAFDFIKASHGATQ